MKILAPEFSDLHLRPLMRKDSDALFRLTEATGNICAAGFPGSTSHGPWPIREALSGVQSGGERLVLGLAEL